MGIQIGRHLLPDLNDPHVKRSDGILSPHDRVMRRVWRHIVCRNFAHLVLARRLGRLVWWTLTLQLPRHGVWWLQARRARSRSTARSEACAARPLPLAHAISVPRHPIPVVSIVIPTYGQVEHTLRCLAAIAADPPAAPIEVIVVDDASPDPGVAQLSEVTGIRLIRQPRNRGFLQ
jgi:hypothetical protein